MRFSWSLITESKSATFVIAAGFTLLLLFNYIFPLGALPYTSGAAGQDCYQMAWNLWHAQEAIAAGHNPFYAPEIFYPAGANLSHHTLAAGYFPITWLVKILTGAHPLYPVYAFRLIVWLAFTLLLWFSFRFLRACGSSHYAAALAAIGYAFCDFYLLHVYHLNHLAAFFLPLAAWLAIGVWRAPTTVRLSILICALAAAIYFTEFALFFYMAGALWLALLCARRATRNALFAKLKMLGAARIVYAALLFLLLIAPFVAAFLRADAATLPESEAVRYSANFAGFFIPSVRSTPLYGNLFTALSARITTGVSGRETFIGFTFLLACCAGMFIARRRAFFLPLLVCALFFCALSMGATLKIFGAETNFPLPFAVLRRVPPLTENRTPVRFVVVGFFCLMIFAAFGWDFIRQQLATRAPRSVATFALLLFAMWTIAEVYQPVARQRAVVTPLAANQLDAGTTLNLPISVTDGYAAWLQTLHHQPIATGFIARPPRAGFPQLIALRRAYGKGASILCAQAAAAGFRNLILAPPQLYSYYLSAPAPFATEDCLQLRVTDLRAADISTGPVDGNASIAKEKTAPVIVSDTTLSVGASESDKYLLYGWSSSEGAGRWTDGGHSAIIFALPEIKSYRLRLTAAPFLAASHGVTRQRAVVKLNGQTIVCHWTFTARETQEVALPVALLNRERNTLEIFLPDADMPQFLGISDDARVLGLFVEELTIDSLSE